MTSGRERSAASRGGRTGPTQPKGIGDKNPLVSIRRSAATRTGPTQPKGIGDVCEQVAVRAGVVVGQDRLSRKALVTSCAGQPPIGAPPGQDRLSRKALVTDSTCSLAFASSRSRTGPTQPKGIGDISSQSRIQAVILPRTGPTQPKGIGDSPSSPCPNPVTAGQDRLSRKALVTSR